MEEIKLYSPTGEPLLSTLVDDSSYRLRQIMGDNNLLLYFSLPEFFNIQEGAYCDFKAERYWMPEATNYVKEHTEHFAYSLKMEGSLWMLKATKFKFFDYVTENGIVKATSSFKLKFPFTATPRMLAQLIVANLKEKYPQYDWQEGECIDSEPVVLDFNHDTCFSVLAKAVEKFKTEWELDKYTLHFRQVEKMRDSAIDLSYGYNKGLLGGIQRLQLDSKRIVNRVLIEGGDRNIDRSTYGNDTLLLPKNKRITYEGIEYTTDASGSYLERVTSLAGQDDSLDISKHYPRRVGKVTAVEKINDEQGLYNIIDATIPENLDFAKHVIAGETMTIIFQDSKTLAGKEFDVKYIHKARRFELKPIDDRGLIYPHGNLIPEVGDTYAVFHMNMPKQYIDLAENDALQDTVEHLWKNEQSQNAFRFTLDGNYASRKWGEIRGYLNCGFFINFSDPQLQPVAVKQRIVAVKEMVNDDRRPEITIANNISSKTFGSIINEIPTQEQATDRKDREVREYAKRGFRQAQETMQMLIEAGLEGYDEAIRPIIVQTMGVLVGSPQLQFFYVNNQTEAKRVPSGIYFDKDNKRLVCPIGLILHQTLGFEGNDLTHHTPDKFKYWNAKAYQSDELTGEATNKSYYLYLRCAKNNPADGQYIISETAKAIDELTNYYHFLVGILNSEDETGNRSWVEMFGITEILPSGINTDKIVSSDGLNFIDFINNTARIGSNNSYMQFNELLELVNAGLKMYNSNKELVSHIDSETGEAMFGKGANIFDALGNVLLASGAHRFFSSGNLDLANGNLLYDLINGLSITGKFESNKSGNKIVIDPDSRTFKMLSKDGYEVFSLSFSEGISWDKKPYIIPIFRVNRYLDNKLSSYVEINGERIGVYPAEGASFFVADVTNRKIWIDASKLPQNKDEAHPREVYMDGEVLKVFRYV